MWLVSCPVRWMRNDELRSEKKIIGRFIAIRVDSDEFAKWFAERGTLDRENFFLVLKSNIISFEQDLDVEHCILFATTDFYDAEKWRDIWNYRVYVSFRKNMLLFAMFLIEIQVDEDSGWKS